MTQDYVDSADPLILWFRSDLRLRDHPGVASAVEAGRPIIPVYIWDEALGTRPLGRASRWWLHRTLKVLGEDLRALGSRLIIRQGPSLACLSEILSETKAKTIVYSSSFDPAAERNDDAAADFLLRQYVDFECHNAMLLAPPGAVLTKGGGPFRVFTPYYRALVEVGFCQPHAPVTLPAGKWREPESWPSSLSIDSLRLNETVTASGMDWAAGFDRFVPGEHGAKQALNLFLDDRLETYANDRDRPDKSATSCLSPHLRFGEISPQRILYELDKRVADDHGLAQNAEKFRSELIWREFSYGLLDQQPQLHRVNIRTEFDEFPWRDNESGFRAWCRGETGYDLVDAGMRELWQTGYMHNRVRMVCASFLVKHLLIDWRRGEQWFWDCLLDADPANNPASWQWVAGCGADAAPYFRIFNPLTQADKFDPAGLYRGRYLPGYTESPTGAIHSKRQADLFDDIDKSRSENGRPQPIIDHAFARTRALEAYQSMRHHFTEEP